MGEYSANPPVSGSVFIIAVQYIQHRETQPVVSATDDNPFGGDAAPASHHHRPDQQSLWI